MARLIRDPLPMAPHACCVTGRIDGEFVDLESVPDCSVPPHIYVGRGVFEHIAKVTLKMVPAENVAKLQERLDAMSQELEDLKEVKEALAVLESHSQEEPVHAS